METNVQEIWRSVVGYEGLYKIDCAGRVYSFKYNKILKHFFSRQGYPMVKLYKDKKRKTLTVHRLVAKAFLPNILGFKVVNHVNGIKADCSVQNLEWTTNSGNQIHAIRTGLRVVGEYFKSLHKGGITSHFNKPINQLDASGNFLASFYNIKEASLKTGIQYQHIGAVANGKRKTAGGYRWEHRR